LKHQLGRAGSAQSTFSKNLCAFSSPPSFSSHKDFFAIPTFNAHRTTEKNPIYNPNALYFPLLHPMLADAFCGCAELLLSADALIA
jgi:hypothetical protein